MLVDINASHEGGQSKAKYNLNARIHAGIEVVQEVGRTSSEPTCERRVDRDTMLGVPSDFVYVCMRSLSSSSHAWLHRM